MYGVLAGVGCERRTNAVGWGGGGYMSSLDISDYFYIG